MKKVILIICILGAVALSFANNAISYDELTIQASHGECDRSNVAASISAGINGHNLTVSFSQNIGEVSVEITSLSGTTIYNVLIQTPTGYQYYIPTTGSYVITFTLPNGDEYYGEFEVTD
ncbi:MAG: DUF3244 domain-containing protein [bacterium]|nr:DUF3244 domain-containing protein [Candidatus Limimorpha caballi]